jgi:hypothetical protein
MSRFRRVEGEQAGPTALGILIPPAKRTFVILRPRSLDIDLLLCRAEGDPQFRDLSHDEASAAAQSLYRCLRESPAKVEEAAGHLWLVVSGFIFVACLRRPNQPYAPLSSPPEGLASRLRSVIAPPDGVEQELYFNVRHFERPAE